MLSEGAKTQKEIAAELKVTEQTIVNWKKRKDFQEFHREFAIESLANGIGKLVANQIRLALDADSDSVKFSATRDLLDRARFELPLETQEESEAQKASEKFDELIKETAKARIDLQASTGVE